MILYCQKGAGNLAALRHSFTYSLVQQVYLTLMDLKRSKKSQIWPNFGQVTSLFNPMQAFSWYLFHKEKVLGTVWMDFVCC